MKREKIQIIAKEKGFESYIKPIHDNLRSPDGGIMSNLLYYLWLCELQKWLIDNHDKQGLYVS